MDASVTGNEPVYMTENPTQYLFKTKAECRDEHYSWNKATCMGGSSASLASGTKYYAPTGPQDASRILDLQGPWITWQVAPPGSSPTSIVAANSTHKFGHMQAGTSSSGSASTASDEWYVVWSNPAKCVKNCVAGTGTGCGGPAESWDTKYEFNPSAAALVSVMDTRLAWHKVWEMRCKFFCTGSRFINYMLKALWECFLEDLNCKSADKEVIYYLMVMLLPE
ncbi:hypothetical protein ACHAWO_013175 [Cyclotella atomus]|uniref:Uncharacterized protein n=1 Tax=Cyclotella atomus TaxID=382360 RepID=A0ABD3MRA0_9STRA